MDMFLFINLLLLHGKIGFSCYSSMQKNSKPPDPAAGNAFWMVLVCTVQFLYNKNTV